jgi:hypothetical protein
MSMIETLVDTQAVRDDVSSLFGLMMVGGEWIDEILPIFIYDSRVIDTKKACTRGSIYLRHGLKVRLNIGVRGISAFCCE